MFQCGFGRCRFNSNDKREVLFHVLLIHGNHDNFKTKCCFQNCQITFKTCQKFFTHVETYQHTIP